MNRILGVASLLMLLYGLFLFVDPSAATRWNTLKDVCSRQAFYGILTIGAGTLIVTGGIDLSIGSVVGLSAVGFGILMKKGYSANTAAAIVLFGGMVIGLIHGLLITRLKLQAFLVTLCGLFIYRGIARLLSPGETVGLQDIKLYRPNLAEGLDKLGRILTGKGLDRAFGFPMLIVVMLVIALILGVVLHASVYGRYWYAMGRNEQAARYAGINTDRQRLLVYVICSTLASLGGILYLFEYSSANANDAGMSWELYAITGAVLGGCSLRGGEGTILGMVLGAAVLPLLSTLISVASNRSFVAEYNLKVDDAIPVLTGLTLLLGTIADEFLRRRSRKAQKK